MRSKHILGWLTSLLLALMMVAGLCAAMPLVAYADTPPGPSDVCEISGTGYPTFADSASISDYAQEAVSAMQAAGIITGKPGNNFDPQGKATRAEVATICNSFLKLSL